jgi:hypothetical protein
MGFKGTRLIAGQGILSCIKRRVLRKKGIRKGVRFKRLWTMSPFWSFRGIWKKIRKYYKKRKKKKMNFKMIN